MYRGGTRGEPYNFLGIMTTRANGRDDPTAITTTVVDNKDDTAVT